MADAALFEFLHTEMVAELWAHDPDPSPGGQKMSLSVLEGMGFRVGQALGERLPRETLAFREELDVLKFLCKDLWVAVFQKQIDSLRTNHQGTYVLQDNSFPLLVRMASGLQYLEEAPKFLAFTCGLLRGTLSTLGIKSLVTASVAALPACEFQGPPTPGAGPPSPISQRGVFGPERVSHKPRPHSWCRPSTPLPPPSPSPEERTVNENLLVVWNVLPSTGTQVT
uniref:Trafficking protein particle complex subunit 6A n=1 Tax=Sus scrofa TaxID=9823 RepID=A0A8D1UZC3_PIG